MRSHRYKKERKKTYFGALLGGYNAWLIKFLWL